ncbi:MAG: hypothetical protein EOO93_20740 [Pedobacter sp.]|nr:MAG: hypothetical protein EOO93_20740 [Pedobacter sp.]
MKKLLLIICVCIVFSCKKDNASENITAYNWVLKAQIISPAITIDGKTSTDYLSLQNPEGCTKNFAYTFLETGIFTFGSNGALCDMIANTNSQKWKLEEDQITLDYGNGSSATPPLKVNENTLTQTSTITVNGTNYSLTSTYVAQKIK